MWHSPRNKTAITSSFNNPGGDPKIRIKSAFGCAIGHKLNCTEQTYTSHIADHLYLGKALFEPPLKMRTHDAGSIAKPFFFEDIENGVGCSNRNRMTGISIPMREYTDPICRLLHDIVDLLANDGA